MSQQAIKRPAGDAMTSESALDFQVLTCPKIWGTQKMLPPQ
jgi:hypothetical protein